MIRCVCLSLGGLLWVAGCGSVHPNIETLRAFRAAKKAGDPASAARYLAADARIWFGEKAGEGHPLGPQGGPYKAWDREFRSESSRRDMRATGQTVTYITEEINDYYRLIERQPTPARVTYYFDGNGRITGMLYKGLSTRDTRPPDRYDEFKAWADHRYPGLLDSPEMKIPNQPQRWRELLTEWRADSGLPPIQP